MKRQMKTLEALAACAGFVRVVTGHMLMTSPEPFNAASKGPVTESTYPCQGEPESDSASVTVKAGEEISFELEGSACHGGGSCQWSLSYDDMETWIVIESMIGGCPIKGGGSSGGQGSCQLQYSIPIPEDAPSGKPVFAWTWSSKNTPEYYMNCAYIEIEDGGDGFTAPQAYKMDLGSLSSTCETDYSSSGSAIIPNPGKVVVLGGEYAEGITEKAPSKCTTDDNTAQLYVDSNGNQATGSQGSALPGQTASFTSGDVVTLEGAESGDGNSDFSNDQPADESGIDGGSSDGSDSTGSETGSDGTPDTSGSDASGSAGASSDSSGSSSDGSSSGSGSTRDSNSGTSDKKSDSDSYSGDGTATNGGQAAANGGGSGGTCSSNQGWLFKSQAKRLRKRRAEKRHWLF